MESRPAPRVLHVVECYGGGVASALDQYVRATPELSHHLIRRLREDFAEDGQSAAFDSVAELGPGLLAARRSVRARVRELAPAVVHAHSSFGGLFARTTLLRRRPRIVYTAHGYGFERRDVPGVMRAGYFAAERLLGLNTDAYASCSERERGLSRRVAPRRAHVLLVNAVEVAGAGPATRPAASAADTAPSLVGMGRLGASKDPALFVEVVDRVRGILGPVTATWIGDGPHEYVDELVTHDIEVTGWLPRSEAFDRLAAASAYVNTSAWESGPMALLEAEALGVPILARRLPTFAACPPDYLADSASELADRVVRTLSAPGERDRNLAAWSRYFEPNTVVGQKAALFEAYALESR